MRRLLPAFDYTEPNTLDAIPSSLSVNSAVLAGGTDLIVFMREKGLRPAQVVSLRRLAPQLNYIRFDDKTNSLRIGTMATIHSIELSEMTKGKFFALSEAASQMGNGQIRNIATIGGNICTASPAADMVPPLIALGSTAVLLSIHGNRSVPVESLFLGPGKTVLRNGEILKEVSIPEHPGAWGCSFLKVSRKMSGCSIVNVAVFAALDGNRIAEARVVLGAVAPTPVRASTAEKELVGKATDDPRLPDYCKSVLDDIRPIGDVRAGVTYRQRLARVLAWRALAESIRRARSA